MEAQIALQKEVLKKAMGEKRWTIAVTGQVNAGKSSFINTILQGDYLHVSSIPATSGLCFIQHADEPTLHSVNSAGTTVLVAQREAIPIMVKQANDYLREGKVGKEVLLLKVPIPAFDQQLLSKFEFVDTPGPNEAANESVKKVATEIFNSADFLIMVINYTMMGTSSEHEMWVTLSEMRRDLLSEQRLLLIVNKFDQRGQHGLDELQTKQYVQQKVRDVTGYQLDLSAIILTSSKSAMAARLMESKLVTPESDTVKRLYAEYFPYGDVEDPREQFEQLSKLKWGNILEKSGLLKVEEWIRQTISNSSICKSIIAADYTRLSTSWDKFHNEARKANEEERTKLNSEVNRLQQMITSFEQVVAQIPNRVRQSYGSGNIQFSSPSCSNSSHDNQAQAASQAQQLVNNCQAALNSQLAPQVNSAVSLIRSFSNSLGAEISSRASPFQGIGIHCSISVGSGAFSQLSNVFQSAAVSISVNASSAVSTSHRQESYVTTEPRTHSRTNQVHVGWRRQRIFGIQVDKEPIYENRTETWTTQEAVTRQRQVPVYNVDGSFIANQAIASANSWASSFRASVDSSAATVAHSVSQSINSSFASTKNQVQQMISGLKNKLAAVDTSASQLANLKAEGDGLLNKIRILGA